jgi:hypothetical protein
MAPGVAILGAVPDRHFAQPASGTDVVPGCNPFRNE